MSHVKFTRPHHWAGFLELGVPSPSSPIGPGYAVPDPLGDTESGLLSRHLPIRGPGIRACSPSPTFLTPRFSHPRPLESKPRPTRALPRPSRRTCAVAAGGPEGSPGGGVPGRGARGSRAAGAGPWGGCRCAHGRGRWRRAAGGRRAGREPMLQQEGVQVHVLHVAERQRPLPQ